MSAYITDCGLKRGLQLPANLSTTLKKLELVSETNQVLLRDFYDYMQSRDHKSERHIVSLLTLLISHDKFYGSFTSIQRSRF